MNRLLLFLFILFISAGCENSGDNNNGPVEDTSIHAIGEPVEVQQITSMDSAKQLLTEAQGLVKKGIMKEMPGAEVNQKLTPIMTQFMEIYKRLPPADTAVIYQFRLQQMRELSELQVKMQTQK